MRGFHGAVRCTALLSLVTVLAAAPLPKNAASSTITSFGKAGTVIFDASHNHTAFTPPAKVRTFENMEAFAEFAKRTLNAIPIRDKSGTITGVRGTLIQIGTPYIARRDKKIVPVRDAIATYLGGTSGTIVIGNRVLRLTGKQSGMLENRVAYEGALDLLAQAAPPSDIARCSSGYCVHDSSFITNLFIYKSIGGETDETSGGYQTSSSFCWKWGFVPWICTTSSGHNSMSIGNTFFQYNAPVYSDSGTANDTSSLTVKEWAFGTVLGMLGDWTGVCSTHDAGWPYSAVTMKASWGSPCH